MSSMRPVRMETNPPPGKRWPSRWSLRWASLEGRARPYLYVGPTLILTLVLLVYPLGSVAYYSLAQWDGIGKLTFVGLGNYVRLFHDPLFWTAMRTNLIYVVFFSVVPTLLGLVIAALMGRITIKGERLLRGVLLMPQVVTSVAIGVIFGWIFAPIFGVINGVLAALGLGNLGRAWLGDPGTAPIAAGLVGTWMWLGFAIVFFLSGLQKIDESFYEASRLDGANSLQQFWFITLPGLRNEIVVTVIMTLVRAFGSGVFGIVTALTGGGYNTRPVSLYAYQLAFVQNQMGYGSAVTVLLMVLVLGVSWLGLAWGGRAD